MTASVAAQAGQSSSSTSFDPLARWRTALTSGNSGALAQFYSSFVQVKIGKAEQQSMSDELKFWQDLQSAGVKGLVLDLAGEQSKPPDMQAVKFVLSFKTTTPQGLRTRYITDTQVWQKQGEDWKIVQTTHSGVLKMKQPSKLNPNLYPPNVDAKAEIREALSKAARSGKRVILVFGGNWCYDCHVLQTAFDQPDVKPLLDKGFIVVHVDIGEYDKNLDVADQYKVPLKKGVPALAVLDKDGSLLYSAQEGEFEAARSMDPDDVIAFLKKWEPGAR